MQHAEMGPPVPPREPLYGREAHRTRAVYMLMGSRNVVSTDDRPIGHGKNENRLGVMYTHECEIKARPDCYNSAGSSLPP